MTREGRIYNGGGFIESRSMICQIWGLTQDKTNCYEWQPPADWPCDNWTAGLVKDVLTFEEKNRHVSALERYIRETFPTLAAWDNYRNYELHGHKFEDGGQEIVIACKRGPLIVFGNQVCWARNSQVTARGNSHIEAADSATIVQPNNYWGNNSRVSLLDLAVLIDWKQNGKVVIRQTKQKATSR